MFVNTEAHFSKRQSVESKVVVDHEHIASQILLSLANTRYACVDCVPLEGGAINYIYRATLSCPLHDQNETVVLKHGLGHAANIRDLQTPVIRCFAEAALVKALNSLDSGNTSSNGIMVRTPRLYDFVNDPCILVFEDFSGSMTLQDFFNDRPEGYNADIATAIGNSLGKWLSWFHTEPQFATTEELAMTVKMNSNAIRKRLMSWYLKNFFDKVQASQALPADSLMRLVAHAKAFLSKELDKQSGNNSGFIHGDYSPRNTLIQYTAENSNDITLCVVDWETCQFGSYMQDIARFIADIYVLSHFNGNEFSVQLMDGIMKGYRRLNEEELFQLAAYIGILLLNWEFVIVDDGPGGDELKMTIAAFAANVFLKACEKDREWFTNGDLRCLFN
ncbi:hypothetical protein BO85DRAFT_499076 [Aspergillus piperis CBS 112811]|uniref:Aminoglycoside phosphotransferase domain-containing protein n=1 Tax=Aspergillus piperis CBS 112811 TaxID=1448313 RepID=A0A8G1QWQ2_9EURO|nr:hypothetical protein BO85DRAFT_499076 [Aspergillus piperis CBS 112811]RAH55273.1 hypothetical protein BO85DRAFT_499076 [Aspergillus piperis CBS 112811]